MTAQTKRKTQATTEPTPALEGLRLVQHDRAVNEAEARAREARERVQALEAAAAQAYSDLQSARARDEYARTDITLAKVRECEARHSEARGKVELAADALVEAEDGLSDVYSARPKLSPADEKAAAAVVAGIEAELGAVQKRLTELQAAGDADALQQAAEAVAARAALNAAGPDEARAAREAAQKAAESREAAAGLERMAEELTGKLEKARERLEEVRDDLKTAAVHAVSQRLEDFLLDPNNTLRAALRELGRLGRFAQIEVRVRGAEGRRDGRPAFIYRSMEGRDDD